MTKDVTAYLRRESKAAERGALTRAADNRYAIVAYMIERGAFKDYNIMPPRPFMPEWNIKLSTEWYGTGRIVSTGEPPYMIVISMQPLPDADWKTRNLRPAALRLYERVMKYSTAKKPRYIGDTYEHVETVPIPNWDYTGATEPLAKPQQITA